MEANFVIGEAALLGLAALFYYTCGGRHFLSELAFHKSNNWNFSLKSRNVILGSTDPRMVRLRLPM